MDEYEERYVAFIDILGFKNLVKDAEQDSTLLEKLVSILQGYEEYLKSSEEIDTIGQCTPNKFLLNMFRIVSFSDCVVISTKNDITGLVLITTLITLMYNKLLYRGIFTRGALSKGKLIHTPSIVLGAGLNNVVEFEKTAAIYPRILIDEPVLKDIRFYFERQQVAGPNLCRKDFDGLYHLDLLHKKVIEMNSHTKGPKLEEEEKCNEYMVNIKQEIEKALAKHPHDLAIKAKIRWLAQYFNESAESFGVSKIVIPE